MSDTKQPDLANCLPWLIAAGLGYLLWTRQDAAPEPSPDPKPTVVAIEKATANVFARMKADNKIAFEQAADKVERGKIKSDKELFDFIQPLTKLARELANKPFDIALEMTLPRNEDGSFAGKEIEAAKVLRRVAKSW